MIQTPSVEELRQRAAARVATLQRIAAAGGSLVGLRVAGIQRFIFDVPTNNAGLEVKARSFLVALLPKVLAWRARQDAALGDDHEVLVAAGRAVLLVPAGKVEAVRRSLRRDARRLRRETGDALAVAVAEYAVAASGSLSDALLELANRLEVASWRCAEDEGSDFWDPEDPPEEQAAETGKETPFAELGRKLRGAEPRVSAVGVTLDDAASEVGSRWSRVLGLAISVGTSIDELPALGHSPRLLLRTDGEPPPAATSEAEVASLPLAGTWIAGDDKGDALDFNALARRSVTGGDAKLGVLRLDVDSLGPAFDAVAKGKAAGDALRDHLALSEAVSLVCGPVADRVTWPGDEPRPVQWILAGGDDLFLVGAWSEILDVSLALRDAIVPPLRDVVRALAGEDAAAKLDLSGGIVVSDPRVPLAHLAEEADEQERLAKGKRPTRTDEAEKGAVAWGGIAMGWADWKLVVELGTKLGEAIHDGRVPRSILRRLIGIHTLWHRAQRALDAGDPRQAAESSKRQWLWAYELRQARAGLDEHEGAALVQRLSKLALEDMDEATGKATERPAAAWLGIVAEIAHRRTRGRGEERG